MKDFHTYREILTQADAWQDALDTTEKNRRDLDRVSEGGYEQVIFTGCGSTYYLSLAAAALFQEMTGRVARAVPAGELFLNPKVSLTHGKTLLVSVSRSGSTTETVRAVEQFKKENHGPVIGITNYGDQPLASLADVPLVIEKGQETSVAQTRSFASMYVAAVTLTSIFAQRDDLAKALNRLPSLGQAIIEKYEQHAKGLGEDLSRDRYYFLGSGMRYGLSCEVNLKMKEMTLTHSEPFHFLEFRHGPMSMITDQATVIGLLSNSNRSHEVKVLDEMAQLGGHTFSLGEKKADVSFESGLDESIAGVLFLPVLQLMAYYRSVKKGLNPDNPTNLTAVVKLSI